MTLTDRQTYVININPYQYTFDHLKTILLHTVL